MSGALPDRVLVAGAARSGVAVAGALAARGVEVVLHDTASELVPDVAPGVAVVLGEHDPEALVRHADALVKSPGVPGSAPVVQAARAAGVPVWSEVEIGFRLLPDGARLVGITGTNGKTTVTELVGAMLAESGANVVVAGNVGVALSGIAGDAPADGIVVCELSSFQLEDVETLRCDAAALINLTPDHLDRHGTMEEYGRCKLRIFERQRATDTAVLNDDDPWVAALEALPGDAAVGAHPRLGGGRTRLPALAPARCAQPRERCRRSGAGPRHGCAGRRHRARRDDLPAGAAPPRARR